MAGGLASIELGCCCRPRDGASSTACLRDSSGNLASTGFRAGLEEEEEEVEVMTVERSSVLSLAGGSETGERDLRAGLRMVADVGRSVVSRDAATVAFVASEEV